MPKDKKPQAAGQKAVNSSKPLPGEIRKLELKKGQSLPQVSSLGRFKSIRGVISTPKPKNQGEYVTVCIAGHPYSVGAMMLRALRGPAPTSKHRALHWNLDNIDNRIENLQWATQKEINAHSCKMNPNRKSNAPQKCKPIRGRKVKVVAKGEEDEDEDEQQPPWKTYKLGIRLAAKELDLTADTIRYAITHQRVTKSGHEFEYVKDELGEGEEFRKIRFGDGPYELPIDVLDKIKNSKYGGGLCHPEISNLGRFKDTSGIIKTPLPDPDGYCSVRIMGKYVGIHGLVCRAFLGRPPADMVDPTPDHYPDRCRSNNHVDNLRWATKREQRENTDPDRESSGPRQSKPLKGRKILGGGKGEEEKGEWVPYGSLPEAVDRIKKLDGVTLKHGNISRCCHGRISQTGGYEFKYDEEAAAPRVLPGEIWWDIIETK